MWLTGIVLLCLVILEHNHVKRCLICGLIAMIGGYVACITPPNVPAADSGNAPPSVTVDRRAAAYCIKSARMSTLQPFLC